LYRPLDGLDVGAGTQFANIATMPAVRANSASQSASKSGAWPAVVVVLALGAAGIFFWIRPNRATRAGEGGAPESTLALETFVVNLNGNGQRAYLRASITLGLARPIPYNQPEAASTALVRDTILSVLATAQPDELLKVEGKRRLKEELLKALQERVPQMAVTNVYFTEFLVQM
jgi:flagellar basal body-associated protein FliL